MDLCRQLDVMDLRKGIGKKRRRNLDGQDQGRAVGFQFVRLKGVQDKKGLFWNMIDLPCRKQRSLALQESAEKITVISEDGTIREIHRGYPEIGEKAAKYGRLPSGHPEGWIEAMGNLYRSFTECLNAKLDGTFDESMIDYPTVEAGAEGLAFVEACLKSSQNGNGWVEL